jgi:hypothetical protein
MDPLCCISFRFFRGTEYVGFKPGGSGECEQGHGVCGVQVENVSKIR